jgi:hypothetical protein
VLVIISVIRVALTIRSELMGEIIDFIRGLPSYCRVQWVAQLV